ncbi:hypothetical protein FS837_002730, partial [Tulasnella sp. UAMH 9824]
DEPSSHGFMFQLGLKRFDCNKPLIPKLNAHRISMSDDRTSQPSEMVVFTYKHMKITVFRPSTHEAAVRTAKAAFTLLKEIPSNCITFSAVLVDHPDHGSVEISSETWNLASVGVESFVVEIIDDGLDPKALDGPMAPEPPKGIILSKTAEPEEGAGHEG